MGTEVPQLRSQSLPRRSQQQRSRGPGLRRYLVTGLKARGLMLPVEKTMVAKEANGCGKTFAGAQQAEESSAAQLHWVAVAAKLRSCLPA